MGDGVKQSKEGRRMPGVKKLFQESENSAKPEYIHGHMFGGLGILAGSIRSRAFIPLSIRLHDGLQAAMGWKGAAISDLSHVVQMVEDAYNAARTFGDSLLLPDRYFLTVPALEKLRALNGGGDVRMEIVTKAKKSCTAFEKPGPRKLRKLKQQTGAFCYHFWSKHMPKLSYYQKKGELSPLERVEDEKSRKKVLEAVRATEMHMALSCVAMGTLQSVSLCFAGQFSPSQIRYQRTPSKSRVSEAAVMHYLRKHFFRLLGKQPELCITRIIQEQQDKSGIYWGSWAS